MKNKAVIIAVAIVVLGIAGYLGFTKFNSNKSSQTSNSQALEEKKSLKDLLSSNIAQKCTYSTTNESGSSEGISYISGGKLRGDFATTFEGKKTSSHMISDGKTSYVWTDGEKSGVKLTVSENESNEVANDASDVSMNSASDLNEKVDYKCTSWITDNSYFTPPSNVTFTDFSQIFNVTPSSATGSGSSNSSQCSYCNALSGEEKTECLSALKCN